MNEISSYAGILASILLHESFMIEAIIGYQALQRFFHHVTQTIRFHFLSLGTVIMKFFSTALDFLSFAF